MISENIGSLDSEHLGRILRLNGHRRRLDKMVGNSFPQTVWLANNRC